MTRDEKIAYRDSLIELINLSTPDLKLRLYHDKINHGRDGGNPRKDIAYLTLTRSRLVDEVNFINKHINELDAPQSDTIGIVKPKFD